MASDQKKTDDPFAQAAAEAEHQRQLDDLRRIITALEGQLAKSKDRFDAMIAATRAGAADAIVSLGPLGAVPAPSADRRKRPEVALWHLTDWQGSKVTTSYDSEVMHQRVRQFTAKAAKLTEIQRADHPVRECVIAFGGDMVEGLFNYPAQLWQIDQSLFGQWSTVGRLCAEVVRSALAIYEKVTVVSEWGNHGRIGSKRAEVPREDNVDRMCYELARAMLGDESRLTWEDSAEDIQRIEIGEYHALLMHGDEVGRSGYASPKTFTDHCNRLRAGAYQWEFKDVYVGHFHRHAEEPLADGQSIYWTGSTESDNRYAQTSMAASSAPSQRLHFIDPERGRVTAGYRVWLD